MCYYSEEFFLCIHNFFYKFKPVQTFTSKLCTVLDAKYETDDLEKTITK